MRTCPRCSKLVDDVENHPCVGIHSSGLADAMSAPESDVFERLHDIAERAEHAQGLVQLQVLDVVALREAGTLLRGSLAGQQERIATILTDEERAAVNYTAVVLESDHFAWKDCEVLRGLLKRDAALRGGPSDKEPSRE